MVDLGDAAFDALIEVNRQYANSARLKYALNLNSALEEVMRSVDYSMNDKEVETKLRNAAYSVPGLVSDSYRDSKITDKLEWFKNGKATDANKVSITQIGQRREQAFNSFIHGDSSLVDVDGMTDIVYSGAQNFMTPSALEASKNDFKSKATLYSLSLYKPDEVDELLSDTSIRDKLTSHDLGIVLRENENKRRRAQTIASSSPISKISIDVLTNSIKDIREYDIRLASAGLTEVGTTTLFNELQSIRGMSADQLANGINDPEVPAYEKQLYAARLTSIRTNAGKNITQYVSDSNLPLPELDYASGSSMINRSAHVAAWAEQFDVPINSILTSTERDDIAQFFTNGLVRSQISFLKAVNAINEPRVYPALLKDLDSFDPTARAKAMAVSIGGVHLAEAFTVSDRGLRSLKTSSSPGSMYSGVKRYLGDAFQYMGPEMSDSVTELVSGYLVTKGLKPGNSNVNNAIKALFDSKTGYLGGKYLSGTGGGVPAPKIMLPPGMKQSQATRAYYKLMNDMYESGDIPMTQYGSKIDKNTLTKQVYAVSLGVNQYALMIPAVNGNSVPLLDSEGIPVKISLPYN